MKSTETVVPLSSVTRGDYHEQWEHHAIGFLIRATKHYVVHIDKSEKLDWETTPEWDIEIAKRPAELQSRLNAIQGKICLAEAAPLQAYSEEVRHQYVKLLGEALAHWIEGNADTAEVMLHGASSYLRDRSEELSRRWYLSAGISSAGLFGIAGGLAWLNRSEMASLLGTQGFILFLAACAGAIGAMFSIIVRSGSLRFTASAGQWLHYLEASSRITAGAISGIVVCLAIKSQLVLGSAFHSADNPALLFLATLVAGTGERLATSIISKFDEETQVSSSGFGPTNTVKNDAT